MMARLSIVACVMVALAGCDDFAPAGSQTTTYRFDATVGAVHDGVVDFLIRLETHPEFARLAPEVEEMRVGAVILEGGGSWVGSTTNWTWHAAEGLDWVQPMEVRLAGSGETVVRFWVQGWGRYAMGGGLAPLLSYGSLREYRIDSASAEPVVSEVIPTPDRIEIALLPTSDDEANLIVTSDYAGDGWISLSAPSVVRGDLESVQNARPGYRWNPVRLEAGENVWRLVFDSDRPSRELGMNLMADGSITVGSNELVCTWDEGVRSVYDAVCVEQDYREGPRPRYVDEEESTRAYRVTD
jgi:hypothetical protein